MTTLSPGAMRTVTMVAWIAVLLVSDLPNVLWDAWIGPVPAWLFWAKVAFLGWFVVVTLLWTPIRPLWQYAVVLLVFLGTFGLTSLVRDTAWYQDHFNYKGVPFFTGYLALFVLDSLVMLAVVAALWMLKGHRRNYFLVVGQLDAPIEPVPWLGIGTGGSWKSFGWIFAGCAGLVVLVPTVLGMAPSGALVMRALPLLPAVLLFSAVNAFNEEVYFRASLLATLHEVVGPRHALLMTVVLFGLAHWLYGSPPGVTGFLMTGFLAYLMGKSMLETRGLGWAWFIHFVPDVVIFFSYHALIAVRS